MADEKLPAVGCKAVHKDDHAKTTGPVWEVTGVSKAATDTKPIQLKHAKHKLNTGKTNETRNVSGDEFNTNYVQL